MTDHVDQERLERAIEVFRDFHPEVTEEEGHNVQNLCDSWTERFRDLLLGLLVIWPNEPDVWRIEWFSLDGNRPLPDIYPEHEGEDHCVLRLGEKVYDWTIRQYTDETEVPFVWDFEEMCP